MDTLNTIETNTTETPTTTNERISLDFLSGRISPEILPIDEAAARLRWSKEKLIRLHCERKGPPRIKVGKSIYYHWPSVVAWLLTFEQTEPRAYKRKASKA